MKALVLQQYDQLVFTAVPDPTPEPGEVLVRIAACGICSSDVQGMDGSTGRRIPPIIMGHEAAGTIVALGADVSGRQVGDRVTFGCAIHCGHCAYCRRGLINLCDNRRWMGVSAPGARKHGAYAEYVAVPQQILVAVPDGLDLTRAAFAEPFSVAAHAIARTPHPFGAGALVVGCGPIGLLTIQLLRRAGCARIIAVDRNPPRLALAERCGAHVCIQLRADGGPHDAAIPILRATRNQGVDIAFDTAGSADAPALCVEALRKGGTVTLVGNTLRSVAFPLQMAVVKELTVHTAMTATDEMPACVAMLTDGSVDVAPLISAVAPLAEGPAYFDRIRSRDRSLVKVLLIPGGP